jgi:teichuronic acid biosynthesis glycosyltransferase TuaG
LITKKGKKTQDFLPKCFKLFLYIILKFTKIITKEDYLLWLQLSKDNVKIVGIDRIFTYWRKVNNSLSSDLLKKIKDAFRIYYFYEKKSFIMSIVHVFFLSLFALNKKIRIL